MPRADSTDPGLADAPRNPRNGRLVRSKATIERDAQAFALHIRGRTLAQIGTALGMTPQSAQEAVKRGRQAISIETTEAQVKEAVAELDMARAEVMKVLEAKHYLVRERGLVYLSDDEDAEPLADDKPVLEAVDRLIKIAERRARLLGSDAPTKARIEVRSVDSLDNAISGLLAEMDARDAGRSAGAHPHDVVSG